MKKQITFGQFKKALAVFGNDYQIVNHPETPKVSPFDVPNPAGTYSLTQIPAKMTEGEFVKHLRSISDIVVTCMDKDCAHSTWYQISQKIKPKNIMMLTFGGGVVQHNLKGREGAIEAIETIAQYLSQTYKQKNLPKLKRIHCDDHDSVCGAVKAFLGGTSLPDLLNQIHGKSKAKPHGKIEKRYMASLIRHGAGLFIKHFNETKVEVLADLHSTNRDNPTKSKLVAIELAPGLPERNIAAILEMKADAVV